MERRNAFDDPQGLPNLLEEYVHGALAARFCIALGILLSCWLLSTQPLEEDPQAQYNRGVDYWYGRGVPQDYTETANWFRKAADRGYAEAQYRLGQMLAIGQGIPQDDTEVSQGGRTGKTRGANETGNSWRVYGAA
jgi:TPR repeat protein